MSYSRTTYSRLFSKIGTTWGAGDGNTTFNVPNFVDRIPQGIGSRGTVGTYIAESLPNVKGYGHMMDGGSCCFTTGEVHQFVRGGDSAAYQNRNITFNASLSSSTYQDNAPVQQAATAVVFCIRY